MTRIIADVVIFKAEPSNEFGNATLMASLVDGELVALHTYFTDEQRFDRETYVGHSLEWAKEHIDSVHRASWGLRTELSRDAHYDHAVYTAWNEARYAAMSDSEF
jgi:hypothetical protein